VTAIDDNDDVLSIDDGEELVELRTVEALFSREGICQAEPASSAVAFLSMTAQVQEEHVETAERGNPPKGILKVLSSPFPVTKQEVLFRIGSPAPGERCPMRKCDSILNSIPQPHVAFAIAPLKIVDNP
jgi:hypothetical protein